MAGEKGKTSAQSEASRKANRLTAIKRGEDGGSVKAVSGKASDKKEEDKAAQEAVNAAKVAEEKAKAEKAREAGAKAAKKKKLSPADIAMGRR